MINKVFLGSVPFIFLALSASSKMVGHGENFPTVQSAFGGSYYVRSIPSEDFGSKGKTQVFKVNRDADQVLDEYPVYMRGELFLGWSPIAGKWCLVHLEPARVSSDIDYGNMSKVSRLAFYMGGKEVFSYTSEDLQKLGLKKKVSHLQNHHTGDFIVHGIEQVPLTNHYVFSIEKIGVSLNDTEKLLLDITTGKTLTDDVKAK